MAINKNFVIKNGVEVNTNLLVGDSTLNKVGIATTVPGYTLHIGVGDGARGGIGATDITVSGIATIGVANSTSGALSVTGISTFEGLIDANGGVSARTAAVQDLTSGRVVLAGTGGELEDSANLTFDGSTLTVSGDLDPTNVSIGGTLQVAGVSTFLSGVIVSGIGTFENDIKVGTAATIQSNGAAAFAGIVTANGGLAVGSAASIHSNGNASFSGIVTVGGNLNVTGDYSVDEISARNLILTGIATIPTLGVTGLGTFEKLTVGTGVTLQEHGGVSIAGITTIGGGILLPDGNGNGLQIGNDQDLIIQHNGTNSFIDNNTGDLYLQTTGSGDDIILESADDVNIKANGKDGIKVIGDSFVALFHNDNKKFETTAIGATVFGDFIVSGVTTAEALNISGVATVGTALSLADNVKAQFGTGGDLAVYHDSNHSIINDTIGSLLVRSNIVQISTPAGSKYFKGQSGEAALYYSDSEKLATTNTGVSITGDNVVSANTNISGVTTTGENLGGFKRLVGAASSTVVSIAVTVATKTTDHRYFDQGSTNGYWLDGVQSPFLTLVPGKLYYFDQSHSTNSGHPLRFYLEQDKANSYTTEITTGGTPGSSGAYTQIGIGTASNENNHPAVLHYQCSSHALMGNAVATQSNAVNLPDSVVTTVRGNLMPGTDSQYNIGADGTRFTNIYGDTLYGDGSNLTSLPTQVSIANNADNRVITGGSGVNINGEANLTFDGSTLGITGSIDLSADIDVDGTANLDILDVDGAANFGADVVFAGAAANITFDQDVDDLIFDDNAQAVFGSSSDGVLIYHNGSHSFVQDSGTGGLFVLGSRVEIGNAAGNESGLVYTQNGAVELFHDNAKIFSTTGAGVTVGLSSIQHNGNAAFPGITTLGSPGAGSEVIVNNVLKVNSGANITGLATIANAYIAKLAQSDGTSGNENQVPVATGSGTWNWAPLATVGIATINGITVQEEGSNVGTAGSIATLNFTGSDITASASGKTATINVSSNIQGITTSGTSFLHDITQTGVTTLTSDQQAAFNVGTSATIFSNGNIKTLGVTTVSGGLHVGSGVNFDLLYDQFVVTNSAGVGVATIFPYNGNLGISGIATAAGGFNIGIQSAGIVIARDVGISTLNFVGSGNSITYFAATNTLDVSIAGSSGGGGGGVSETSTSVSSTSPTSTGSFEKASKRSASVLAQITQGSAYQVGRYLVIHDGTTVTTVEESAVATGSMLGTFEGVINGDDVEFRVTMSSSSSATIKTKIDTLSS